MLLTILVLLTVLNWICYFKEKKNNVDIDSPHMNQDVSNEEMALKVMNIYRKCTVYNVEDMLQDGILCINIDFYEGGTDRSERFFFDDEENYNYVWKFVEREERKRKIKEIEKKFKG